MSIFTPLRRNIIRIRISGKSWGHIQTTIALSPSIKRCKICVQIQTPNVYLLKHSGCIKKLLTVQQFLLKQ